MKKSNFIISAGSLLATALVASVAFAHGDVTPQPIDTKTLPTLGAEWLDKNPYTGQAEAIKVGTAAFAENCARCHGLQAQSGGIAPDLRYLDRDCLDIKSPAKKEACYADTDKYFLVSIRHGKVRNGAVYMPPFEGILNQEAMWSIKAYLATLRMAPQ